MALEEGILRVLRKTPILGQLEDEALRMLVNVADMRRLRTDEILFRAGERSDGGFVVLAGAIGVGRDENEAGPVLGPASLVGQSAMFLRMQRPATATALELSDVMRVSPTLMRRILGQFPEAADRIRDHLARDLGLLAAELDNVRVLFESLNRNTATAFAA